ncbi:MAG: TetR/AcrR family transcriptional regulator [Microthrixaceae bacterium]
MSPEEANALVLDAAERAIGRLGFERTTIDDIADEAGVSRSLVYRHFGSRDEILTGVIGRITDALTSDLAQRLDETQSLGDFIEDAMVHVVVMVRSDPSLVSVFSDGGRAAAGRVVGTTEDIKGRARRFAHSILDSAGPQRAAQLRDDVDVNAAVDHLVLVGLALIQGFGPVSDDPELLREYLSTFVVPSLVGMR